MTEYFHCPACGSKARLKHHVVYARKSQHYFVCCNVECRNHFQVLRMSGQPDQIVAQSPHKVTKPGIKAEDHMALGQMGCPTCDRYGKVKMTYRRDDGYWRRHLCSTCGPYYTCQTDDGITVHRRKKSTQAQDAA